MKIVLVNKFFHLNGGSETVFFQEREYLLTQGCMVLDFSMKDERNHDSVTSNYFVPNSDYTKIPGGLAKLGQAAKLVHSRDAVRTLEMLIVDYKPSIAHLHNIYHQLTPSIIPLLKKHGVKVVLTLHDYKLTCPSYLALNNEKICNACSQGKFSNVIRTHCQNSWSKEILLYLEAKYHTLMKSYDGVDAFISPSRFLADQVAWRMPESKMRILHNGIDCDEYKPSFDDGGYALYFGRISHEKGVETLLNAHTLMQEHIPLKIVGTGPLEADLKRDFPQVEFLGYKSGDALKDLIAKASFVVVPSEWYENCSMVVLESMAYAKPIIGSRVGGIPEQIEDGETGYLFEMGNTRELAEKMDTLVHDAALRKSMGQAAREKLEREYSLKDHCESLVNIYTELLSNA